MARKAVECTPDAFAVTLNQMLADVADGIEGGMAQVVRETCKTARRKVRSYARQRFGGTGAYAKGFTYRVSGKGSRVSGEVGNRDLPGLVHLLEKGHATIGGGRVAGRPHVAPAAEESYDELEDGMLELAGRVL